MLPLPLNAIVTTNTTINFGTQPAQHPHYCLKVDGVFAGATVQFGSLLDFVYDADDKGTTFIKVGAPITQNTQRLITPGAEANTSVRVTGATASTLIYISLSPIISPMKRKGK